MYESFFGLKSKPFDLLPNPEFLFPSKSHKRALTYLDYGIRERAGFILLTGEIGSGKTTIVRDLIKKRHERVVLSKIFNTQVDFDQLIAMVNDDFNLPVQGKDRIVLLRDLNEFLIEQYSLGNRPTLIIDEAQNLTPSLLEEIRMLSNLETDDAKLLQIILVGQPELRKTLALPSLLQLRQRISIYCHIQPLSRLEVEEYILHRLQVAGNREAVRFSGQAVDIIYTYSRGIPRLINIICDFIMLSAFAEETREIDEEMVRDIIGDLDFENQYWTSKEQEESNEENLVPSKEKIIGSESELAPILREITRRLDGIEKESMEFRKMVNTEMDEKLNKLGIAVQAQADETSASVFALSKKFENIIKESESIIGFEAEKENILTHGFLRKIFK
jgi:putative secretion ATPase (PEP-CTERM system associated)